MKNSLTLYIHIPFCQHRCAYCDFNTYTTLGELQTTYAQAVTEAIRQVAGKEKRPAHTIFFGGGTPSLMSSADLGMMIDAVRANFALADSAEITIEANPNTVNAPYLAELRAVGVNRLSFGVQSAIATELQLLERTHDFDTVIRAVEMAKSADFTNFNLDLIYGVPGQTLASWETSVRAVLAQEPTHVSLYCLTIEPGTPMQRWLNNGQIAPPDPDLAADQYEAACDWLASAGFDHYEISNWAKPGHQSEHNLSYWRNGEYLGLGAGAHRHPDGYRYHEVKQPRTYIRPIAQGGGSYPFSSAIAEKIPLSRADQITDAMITRLRLLNEGLDLERFSAEFDQTPYDVYGDALRELIDWELLTDDGHKLLLTQRGWFLSNQLFRRFV